VKRGKTETYVKDDAELNALLLRAALDGAALHRNGSAPLQGESLRALAEQFIAVQAVIQRLARRYDTVVLQQMLLQPELAASDLQDADRVGAWAADLERALIGSVNGDGLAYRVSLQRSEDGIQGLLVRRFRHGVEEASEVPLRFFESSEYRKFAELAASLKGLVGSDAHVARGEQRRDVQSFHEAIDWLMAEARKGQTIQRYKGLGEMNPEQLWETTVNPQSRRLMQVRIEDVVAADEIFTTLMGDQVEPRREFIERNALAAGNIDV
jgi:DNA gyrase subunit B